MALDDAVATQWLSAVGYYRLSGYWYPFREANPANRLRPLDTFRDGTSLDEVVRLYEFDRHLKSKVHSGIERVEVAMRSQLGHILGEISPMAHEDPGNFRPGFDHAGWLQTARGRIARSRGRDAFVDHHFTKYGGQLPIWVLTDVLDFADLSKLFAGMRSADQQTLSTWFGITPPPPNGTASSAAQRRQRRKWRQNPALESWLLQLSVVRNIGAHHSRLWNRQLPPATTAALRALQGFEGLPTDQSEKLFGTLCMIGVLLRTTSPGSTWTQQVKELVTTSFDQFDNRTTAEMGFPAGWEALPLWT
ncbi:Abi family protein [Williamsia herbipolensis]|uniref:Abi family protein n=1 Tax=Williamsia herbipolensis TaxID=1603258 RepID=UPI0009E4300A|nr:Abi family protein [Williamsia herbipolensis]